jgi:hypothetical protein
MSKLDGNERWKTKMMLTEHKEQYEERNEPKLIGRPTMDELTMIRDKVVYPHIITMLENGINSLRVSQFPLKDLSIRSLELILQRVSDDQQALNIELRRRNIKVFPDESGDGIMYHKYVCRGYEERFGIAHEAARMEISNKLTAYTDGLKHALTGRNKKSAQQ